MSLKVYNKKRKFNQTPEPRGKTAKGTGPLQFAIQMHSATRLHWDFRLEFGGVLKSWAVPKGPSLNPLDQRLALFVEDHPIDYGSFEGIIPKGNYGAGTVMLWDRGTYVERGSEGRKDSEAAMKEGLEKGHITFVLNGEKLKGEFALIKLKKASEQNAWLLVKKRDEYSTYKRTEIPKNVSVKSGRTLEEIAKESEKAGDVWISHKKNEISPRDRKKMQLPKKVEKKLEPKKVDIKKERKPSSIKDPMPRKIKPMIPTVSRYDVDSKKWIMEPHVGGLRALSEIENKRVHLYSKSGLPFEKKFPKVIDDLRSLDLQAVLDGEIEDSIYYVYDILYFQGRDLRKKPLEERKRILKTAFSDTSAVKHIGAGKDVAKNPDSIYQSGTSSDWLILSNGSSPEKKIEPSRKLEETRSRAVAKKKSDKVSPQIVTDAKLTNLNKIYWPKEGYTKGDLIAYYDKIADAILPYLIDRPESMNRFPNGIEAAGFYQKDMTGYHPKWLKTKRIFSESADKTIDYVLCQDKRSLLYLANLGCIELNPWFSRIQKLDYPDFLVIDLDPDDNPFDYVIEIAHEVREVLESIGANCYCKTSGATGIHIGVPTGAKYDFDQVREFAEEVCKIIAKKYPSTTSVERNPQRRKKKIYLDFMQNRRGQTLAAPYCVRPKPGAPVSMPLEWKELKPGLKPEDFNIENAIQRIQKKKDPWKPILGAPIDLDKCFKTLRKKYDKN